MKHKKNLSDFSLASLGIKLSLDQDLLMSKFFSNYYDQSMDLNQAMALDLYRAINCYRYYRDPEVFIKLNPEAEDHRDEVISLWEEFDQLNSSELAEIALKALEEV